MSSNVYIILEKIKETPMIYAGKESIISLSNDDVGMSFEEFHRAVEYIRKNELIKISKVEYQYDYIVKIYKYNNMIFKSNIS
ncbi:hypothetical protein [uncultured Clostridium sp.]|uniref:hypothetical protein n=1 Tax=uncultured Clostridium sp. TaxID=59620 RepID=UPI0028E74991|nr:hypothetical protein [uncultured Clostridium sp.]